MSDRLVAMLLRNPQNGGFSSSLTLMTVHAIHFCHDNANMKDNDGPTVPVLIVSDMVSLFFRQNAFNESEEYHFNINMSVKCA